MGTGTGVGKDCRTPSGETDAAAQAAAGTAPSRVGFLGVGSGGGVHVVISLAFWASWAHQCAIASVIDGTVLAALAWPRPCTPVAGSVTGRATKLQLSGRPRAWTVGMAPRPAETGGGAWLGCGVGACEGGPPKAVANVRQGLAVACVVGRACWSAGPPSGPARGRSTCRCR